MGSLPICAAEASDEALHADSAEVSLLREEVGRLTQELLMHRKVLEQCLEVRESVLELLEHREALLQCLELREGVQAALSSTQVIGEVVDRTSELDLSLAGVSDNTARHGRAIASLSEQQRRTTETLDAVVRAVKRLDRSRSRQAPPRPISAAESQASTARSGQSQGAWGCSGRQCERAAGADRARRVGLAPELRAGAPAPAARLEVHRSLPPRRASRQSWRSTAGPRRWRTA
ncbi:unnamed protein product [Effrenium voratum]|uniref:Uncharacterized protein n=1 Tax=Effrenium voratum TaxID=2562239 RepID=A0AA36N8C5_9DINO|nr:unnamed protein product [Effrenium voratum]